VAGVSGEERQSLVPKLAQKLGYVPSVPIFSIFYVELGEIPGVVDGGAVAGNGWAGGYVEGEVFGVEIGGGAYLNTSSLAQCDSQ
jgi:hypothetical protein